MCAKHGSKSRLKQVSRGVISLDCVTTNIGDIRSNCVANIKSTVCNGAKVDINTVGLLCIVYVKKQVFSVDSTAIAYLTTALTVEGGSIKNNGAVALVYSLNALVINEDRDNLCFALIFGIACKFSFGKVGKNVLGIVGPTADISSSLSCASSLVKHKSLELLFINLKVIFLSDLSCQVNGEPKCIVKLEYVFT